MASRGLLAGAAIVGGLLFASQMLKAAEKPVVIPAPNSELKAAGPGLQKLVVAQLSFSAH